MVQSKENRLLADTTFEGIEVRNGNNLKSEDKISKTTKRVKYFTSTLLFVILVVALGVTIDRGKICVFK